MSRIGKLPVSIPSGVDVTLDDQVVTVKGPKGTLSHTVAAPITVAKDDQGALAVTRPNDERVSKSLHGLTRTLIANMVTGVTDGYEKKLEIVGVGYRVLSKGPTQLEFQLGYSHPITFNAPDGITFTVEGPTRLGVQGIEFLTSGRITLPIAEPHLSRLRAVRRGEIELAEVLEDIARAEATLDELRVASTVPDQPDRAWVDDWLHRTHLAYWSH